LQKLSRWKQWLLMMCTLGFMQCCCCIFPLRWQIDRQRPFGSTQAEPTQFVRQIREGEKVYAISQDAGRSWRKVADTPIGIYCTQVVLPDQTASNP
jgi:hypothetical protein